MDIRHFDPAEAVEVTDQLAEANPDKNKLYRVGDRVYKATSHWQDDIAKLAGQRRIEVTCSVCDDAGQAVRDGDGELILSAPHVLVISAGLPKTADQQIDEGTRRWIVAFHHLTQFWDFQARGVAVRAADPDLGDPPPAAEPAGAAEPDPAPAA